MHFYDYTDLLYLCVSIYIIETITEIKITDRYYMYILPIFSIINIVQLIMLFYYLIVTG